MDLWGLLASQPSQIGGVKGKMRVPTSQNRMVSDEPQLGLSSGLHRHIQYIHTPVHSHAPTHTHTLTTNAGQDTAFRSQVGHQSIALSTAFDNKAHAWDISTLLKKRKGTGVPLCCSISEFG